MRVKLHLKNGQVIKLKGIDDIEVSRTKIRWTYLKGVSGYKLLTVDPEEIAAVTYRK